jgi:Tfp pilus assembly protein PilF/TolB-like protein
MRSTARRAAALAALALCACTPPPRPAPVPAQIPALEAAAGRAPGDPVPAVRLAAAYRAAGRADDARTLLERALANAPDHPEATLLLGTVYEEGGRLAEAEALYARAADRIRDGGVRDRLRGRRVALRRQALRQAARESIRREGELAGAAPAPGTVAVFPFLFQGDDPRLAPLSRALAEMLSTDLAQSPRLTVLERARVQALVDEMALGASGVADGATAARGGRLLGAAHVVQGGVRGGGDAVGLDAFVVDVARGPDGGGPLSRAGGAEQVLDLEKELALGIYAALGVELTAAERARVSRRQTESLQALLAFGAGLEAMDRGDFAAADASFRAAVAADPGFDLARRRAGDAAAAAGAESAAAVAELAVRRMDAHEDRPSVDLADVAELPDRRDPASESLGGEQIGTRRTGIEIIIRRP